MLLDVFSKQHEIPNQGHKGSAVPCSKSLFPTQKEKDRDSDSG